MAVWNGTMDRIVREWSLDVGEDADGMVTNILNWRSCFHERRFGSPV